MRHLRHLSALFASLAAAQCSSSPGTSADPSGSAPDGTAPAALEIVKSDLPRDASPDVADSDKTKLADGLSAFGFDLFGKLDKSTDAAGKNFACSPASVAIALSMAYAGAAGSTRTQLESVLHVGQDSPTYFRSLDALTLTLGSRADEAMAAEAQAKKWSGEAEAAAPNPDDFRLHIVSSLWGEKTLGFEKPFLDTLATSFGAGMTVADFKGQPDTERLRINAWVSSETKKKINDLLSPGTVVAATRVVLVNAMHLKLPWESPFQESSTSTGVFTRADATTVSAPFMAGGGMHPYAEDDAVQATAIPLRGGSVYFVVLVPKAGATLDTVEDGTLATRASSLAQAMFTSNADVVLTLPRFKFTTASISIKDSLVALGLVDAFSGTADFSGVTKDEPLFFSDVVHKAMVGVDEHGVEAAAATAVMMAGSAAPTDIKYVKADHPFLFGIYDKPTATWLFLGHVADPTQGF
jgi:serpin B